MIYLYLKTHNKTGKKYLGKTEQNPFKYKGSGVVWQKHIKKHGNDVTTTILAECNTNEEAKIRGLEYSETFDVVRSKSFANLIAESGEGVPKGGSPKRNKKISNSLKIHWSKNKAIRSNQNKGRTWKLSPELAYKVSQYFKNSPKDHSSNTIWINNGIINKRLKIGTQMLQGFSKGRMFVPWNKKNKENNADDNI